MQPLTFANLRTVLCLGCHADDIEIGCGGAVLRLLREHPELRVHWAVFSAPGPRRDEALRSAERFVPDVDRRTVHIHDFRDALFPSDAEAIRQRMRELSRRVAPDLIFTHRREDVHQDHRVLAELTWGAFRDHAILEYEIPKYEGDLGQPNVFVPLDEATARRKIELIEEGFPSQRDKPWFRREVFEAMLRLRAVECKAPAGFAEAFHARKLTV